MTNAPSRPAIRYRNSVVLIGMGNSGKIDVSNLVISYERPRVCDGKWMPISLVLRNDIRGTISRMIGTQEIRQIENFDDSTFEIQIAIEHPATEEVMEAWRLHQCCFSEITWRDHDHLMQDTIIETKIQYKEAFLLPRETKLVE